MTTEKDDYDLFLDNWAPDERTLHSVLPSNLHDPLVTKRLLDQGPGADRVVRAAYAPGTKLMEDNERRARRYEYFKRSQESLAGDFRGLAVSRGIAEAKIDSFINSFATHWVDGRRRRQDSPEMMSIKASIRNHDREFCGIKSNPYVINQVSNGAPPLFTTVEMKAIFEANADLLETHIPNYLTELFGEREGSINSLYVRRGVHMPKLPRGSLIELEYLSSYSIATGPVEQFAQTWTNATKVKGVPCIFAAPLPAVQQRVVAFAPFIKGMTLEQLELVVAPPVTAIELKDKGEWGGIREYEFE